MKINAKNAAWVSFAFLALLATFANPLPKFGDFTARLLIVADALLESPYGFYKEIFVLVQPPWPPLSFILHAGLLLLLQALGGASGIESFPYWVNLLNAACFGVLTFNIFKLFKGQEALACATLACLFLLPLTYPLVFSGLAQLYALVLLTWGLSLLTKNSLSKQAWLLFGLSMCIAGLFRSEFGLIGIIIAGYLFLQRKFILFLVVAFLCALGGPGHELLASLGDQYSYINLSKGPYNHAVLSLSDDITWYIKELNKFFYLGHLGALLINLMALATLAGGVYALRKKGMLLILWLASIGSFHALVTWNFMFTGRLHTRDYYPGTVISIIFLFMLAKSLNYFQLHAKLLKKIQNLRWRLSANIACALLLCVGITASFQLSKHHKRISADAINVAAFVEDAANIHHTPGGAEHADILLVDNIHGKNYIQLQAMLPQTFQKTWSPTRPGWTANITLKNPLQRPIEPFMRRAQTGFTNLTQYKKGVLVSWSLKEWEKRKHKVDRFNRHKALQSYFFPFIKPEGTSYLTNNAGETFAITTRPIQTFGKYSVYAVEVEQAKGEAL